MYPFLRFHFFIVSVLKGTLFPKTLVSRNQNKLFTRAPGWRRWRWRRRIWEAWEVPGPRLYGSVWPHQLSMTTRGWRQLRRQSQVLLPYPRKSHPDTFPERAIPQTMTRVPKRQSHRPVRTRESLMSGTGRFTTILQLSVFIHFY